MGGSQFLFQFVNEEGDGNYVRLETWAEGVRWVDPLSFSNSVVINMVGSPTHLWQTYGAMISSRKLVIKWRLYRCCLLYAWSNKSEDSSEKAVKFPVSVILDSEDLEFRIWIIPEFRPKVRVNERKEEKERRRGEEWQSSCLRWGWRADNMRRKSLIPGAQYRKTGSSRL